LATVLLAINWIPDFNNLKAGENNSGSELTDKVSELKIKTAKFDDVIRIFGEPLKYAWGNKTFRKDNLPSTYCAVYPNNFVVVMSGHRVVELRFHKPGYIFNGELQVGSSLEDALEILGQPQNTIEGKPNGWKPGILYKEIDGKKGYCYYSCPDQNIRLFFQNYFVNGLYITSGNEYKTRGNDYKASRGSFRKVRPIKSVKQFDDVRWKDLSALNLSKKSNLTFSLRFNEKTIWPTASNMPKNEDPQTILRNAMNPGLGIRELHKKGITGKGISVAIIDQPLFVNNPEFAKNIVSYHDVGCGTEGSMHGPAVASLLVGVNCGTAPDAKLYYVAAPSWTKDTYYYALALDWIIEKNKNLPKKNKIRVVSVSAAPSGLMSPFEKNKKMWDKACARAEKDGILVLDCTNHRGFIGLCWYDRRDPENITKCKPGFRGLKSRSYPNRILAPTAPRTTSEQYEKDDFIYQYCGRGGLSWAIPYTAGVLSLGWQIRPDLSPQEMRNLLFASAYKTNNGCVIIDPKNFIRFVSKYK